MRAKGLLAKSDCLLVTGQVTGEYQAKDPQMVVYLEYVQVLKESFEVFELVHVPREQNSRADLLVKLASSGKGGRQRTVIQETLKTPRTTTDNMEEVQHVSSSEGTRRSYRSLTQETMKTPRISRYPVAGEIEPQVHQVESGETWMKAYQRYLADEVLPLDSAEAQKIKKNSSKYTLIDGKLFRHRFTHPILVCMDGEQCTRIMAELHDGICGSDIGDRSLSSKAIRAGYYWPTIREDCTRYAQRCKQC
ncbi:uncharacterized protein [Phaseolus vulgaris]|uniref:uncharacterized protein n=1 Tax=Phaseolus vulgaris TaxID=3885 RepID=UPI0035CC1D67